MDRPTVINKTDHEIICQGNGFVVRRVSRFLLGELQAPHRVLSTSIHGGGQSESIQYVINHQSCEVAGHAARQVLLSELGQIGYHNQVCKELGLPPDEVALMGTAANMRYAVHRNERYEELAVDAVVTAGVEGNAVRAGDEAHWVETESGWKKIFPYSGTINIMLFFNWPLTAAAQVCAAVTMTEAKSAALQELAVASRYSEHLATGTGTDQFIIAAPLNDDRKPKESTGPHAKLGEMIGRAVLGAIKEALRWQKRPRSILYQEHLSCVKALRADSRVPDGANCSFVVIPRAGSVEAKRQSRFLRSADSCLRLRLRRRARPRALWNDPFRARQRSAPAASSQHRQHTGRQTRSMDGVLEAAFRR